MEKNFQLSLPLTETEINILANIFDTAIRAKGLEIAQNAVVLITKIQQSLTEIK